MSSQFEEPIRGSGSGVTLSFWSIYRPIRRRIWAILLLTLVATCTTFVLRYTSPLTYRAYAILEVAVGAPSVTSSRGLDWFSASVLFSNIQEWLTSRTVLSKALETDPSLAEDYAELWSSLEVIRLRDSNLIRVSATGGWPTQARDRANTVARSFLDYYEEITAQDSAVAEAYYSRQVELARQRYEEAETNLRQIQIQKLAWLDDPSQLEQDSDYQLAQQEVEQARAIYYEALDNLEFAQLSEEFPELRPATVHLLEPAVAPIRWEPRRTILFTAIAGAVSLAIGVFLAIALEMIDPRARSLEVVSATLGLPLLAMVPLHGRIGVHPFLEELDLPLVGWLLRRGRKREWRPLPLLDELPLEMSEPYRQTAELMQKTGKQAFLVTSSRQADGKTTTAANLALALAQAGKQVVVVDANLRHARLHIMLGLEAAPGLTDLIVTDFEPDDVVATLQQAGESGLWLLAGGEVGGTPSVLLSSEPFGEIIQLLRARFDYVLCDSPALGSFADPLTLARHFGRVLLVVDARNWKPAIERRSVSVLEELGSELWGIVLNKVTQDPTN
jgi:capsular exopolysaccharide synthesis family protein